MYSHGSFENARHINKAVTSEFAAVGPPSCWHDDEAVASECAATGPLKMQGISIKLLQVSLQPLVHLVAGTMMKLSKVSVQLWFL
eukprot:1145005-Pelagomonas_calceolata.AAC.4